MYRIALYCSSGDLHQAMRRARGGPAHEGLRVAGRGQQTRRPLSTNAGAVLCPQATVAASTAGAKAAVAALANPSTPAGYRANGASPRPRPRPDSHPRYICAFGLRI